jgi:hypothetical protein
MAVNNATGRNPRPTSLLFGRVIADRLYPFRHIRLPPCDGFRKVAAGTKRKYFVQSASKSSRFCPDLIG